MWLLPSITSSEIPKGVSYKHCTMSDFNSLK